MKPYILTFFESMLETRAPIKNAVLETPTLKDSPATTDNSKKVATTEYVNNKLGVVVSQQEAEQGTVSEARIWSPQRIKQAIVALSPPPQKISADEISKIAGDESPTAVRAWSGVDFHKSSKVSIKAHLETDYGITTDTTKTVLGNSLAFVEKSTGNLRANKVYNGVYNDYAEYRQSVYEFEPGEVLIDGENGLVVGCDKSCAVAPMVVSDTYGICMGKMDVEGQVSIPIALTGRVLVQVEGELNSYKIGDVLCSSERGKAKKMKFWQKVLFPERILGVVSEIPTYKQWGEENVKVGKRLWVRLR